MANKLTSEKLDLLIEQVLNEKINPLDKEHDDQVLKFKDGNNAVHSFDKSNSNKNQSRPGKPSREYMSSMTDLGGDKSQFDIEDIKAALRQIVTKTATDIKKDQSKYLDWLSLSKADIEKRGNSTDKKYWNAAIAIMQNDYDTELDKGNSRYKIKSKLENIKPIQFYISGHKPENKHFKGNWLQLAFDPEPAAAANMDMPQQTPKQINADLFALNIASAPSETAQFPTDVANSADVIFAGAKNLYERIKVVTDVSKQFFNPTARTISQAEMPKEFAKVVFLDYINEITKNMDDRASAYLFESFLALIAGGRVEGASTEDEGVMGATDFTIGNEGAKGSCKYYTSYSAIKQKISGFKNNEPIHYIVALKEKEEVNGQKVIKKLNIYYFKVSVEILTNKYKVNYFDPEGANVGYRDLSKKETEVPMNFADLYRGNTYIGDIMMLSDDREEYKTIFQKNISDTNKDLSSLVNKASSIADTSRSMNTNLREYIMKDDSVSGDQAVRELKNVNIFMQEMYNELTKLGFKSTTEKLTENKKSQTKSIKDLDKLIERVILESMNKK